MLHQLKLLAGRTAQAGTDPDALGDAIDSEGVTAIDWATAGAIVVVAVVASRVLKAILKRVLCRYADGVVADLVARLVGYLIVVVGLIYALEQVGVKVGPLLGALGIVGLAMAFALRDILENFVAGLILQFRRPFSYGDEVVSGEIEGTVQSIDARTVTIATPDGETVKIPASQVITDPIVNHTVHGARRTTLPIGVAYGTDLPTAQKVLLDATCGADGVLAEPKAEVLLTGFGDSSIDFDIWFWHEPSISAYWHTQDAVAFAVERASRDHGIEIPFPQRVVTMVTQDSVG